MAGSKSYTSESGTTYTQRNDSVYDWHNNQGASGQIRLNPNSGGPTGIYYPIEKRGNLIDTDSPLSQEYVDKHVRNIQEGLKKNGFVAPPSLWTDFRNWFGPKIVQLGEWITAKQNGGRLQNFINNAYAGQDYSGAMGAGSMGLQKIQRKKEEIAQREGNEVANQYENQAKTFAGIGAAIPAAIYGHQYVFGPMVSGATTVAEQAAQGGVAGSLILGDVGAAGAGLGLVPYLVEKIPNTRFNYNAPASKKEGGNINYSKLFVK